MNAAQWQRAKNLLAEAIALEPTQRAYFLERVCEGDSELRHEIESLLSSHDQVDTSFLKSAVDLNALLAGARVPTPRRVGAYEIIEEIGRGGMGEVYRAVRADGQFTKEVAIKLVRGSLESSGVSQRFRNERQILASLDHPNIARLLDGGVTNNGVPYLVMELVYGKRIDVYCQEQRLSVPERLELFGQVCAAVQYAHQHLVIHRDLKPSNIMVTKEGVPKLLDFGIAKILAVDVDAGDATLTMTRCLTPQYASPEQIRGEPITTASDIYSLGVVLYELLTGQGPYSTLDAGSQDSAQAVRELTPPKPSAIVRLARSSASDSGARSDFENKTRIAAAHKLAKHLRGDLDNIVLMALRKEPQRRYSSVEQFADDIRRYLGGRPVIARKDTARYRASKFVARHKAGVAASISIALILVIGLIVTVRERSLAERRFNDVRSLANSLIFDVHDSIKELPGSTPARKLIVERALQYLNVLARESAGDLGLQRELAAAYERVGSVQGDYLQNNLGDAEGALVSYKKALEIRKQVGAASTDWNDQLALTQTYRLVADQLWVTGDPVGARTDINQAIRISDTLMKSYPENPKILFEVGFDHEVSGQIGFPGDPREKEKVIEDYQGALAADDEALKLNPNDIRTLHGYARDLSDIADVLEGTNPPASLENYRKALEINRKLMQLSSELRYRRSIAVAYGSIARVYDSMGDYGRALENDRQCLEVYRDLIQADPKNALLKQGLAIAYVNTATAWARVAKHTTALEYSQIGLDIMRPLVVSSPQNAFQRKILAAMFAARGIILIGADQPEAALSELDQARSIYESLDQASDATKNTDVAACAVKMGEAAARARHLHAAAGYFHQALTILEPMLSNGKANLDALYAAADAYSGLGDLSTKKAQQSSQIVAQRRSSWLEARSWYLRSLATWGRIEHPNHTAPNAFQVGDPSIVTKALKKVEAALSADDEVVIPTTAIKPAPRGSSARSQQDVNVSFR